MLTKNRKKIIAIFLFESFLYKRETICQLTSFQYHLISQTSSSCYFELVHWITKVFEFGRNTDVETYWQDGATTFAMRRSVLKPVDTQKPSDNVSLYFAPLFLEEVTRCSYSSRNVSILRKTRWRPTLFRR